MPSMPNMVDDGIVRGAIERNKGTCSHCRTSQKTIYIDKVTLPQSIKPGPSLILYTYAEGDPEKKVFHIVRIGIGCGCYAKAHRQIAHITSSTTPKS